MSIKKPKAEQVLVFPTSLIDARLFDKSPLLTDKDAIEAILCEIVVGHNLLYIDREEAEKNENYLQVIPYTVIWRGREVFCYQRTKKGGESRLHDKWSLGVGGHINPIDGRSNIRETYWKAFQRELKEEVALEHEVAAPVTAMLYDRSDAVGRVHFGLVHFIAVGINTPMQYTDPSLSKGEFRHSSEFRHEVDSFEKWSQAIIKGLL